MSAKKSPDEDAQLLERLRPEASVAERLRGFAGLGLGAAQVRQAISVSPESLRLWAKGGPVRRSNRLVIDNIGRTAAILLKGTEGRAGAVHWLTNPLESHPATPLELIRDQPEAVLAAADAHVAGRVDQERDFLAQAAESRDHAGSISAPRSATGSTDRSSTQVKRILLARLHEITANHASAQDVMRQLDTGYEPEFERLPNYEAYRRFLNDVREELRKAGDAPAQQAISRLLTDASAAEEGLRELFEDLGARLVRDNTTILTYALSMRVIQALWGVADARQASCKLYVAEGRVKSIPESGELPAFADAAEILYFLAHTGYDRYIVPDAVAPSLIEEGKVQLVMLGAQKVFTDDDGVATHFVATAGTSALLRAARARGVDVSVFAEEEKIVKGVTEPKADLRERVVSVRLPPTRDGAAGGYAPLLTISAELCKFGDDTASDSSVVRLVTQSSAVPG